MKWIFVDTAIILVYALQHSLLTTKIFVAAYNKIFPEWSWNLSYSILSVLVLILGFHLWEPSHVYIFRLAPGSIVFHISVIILSLSLFFFFYLFKYTTSFWQWIGIKQVITVIRGAKFPEYYRVRKNGVKAYIRFPHHTALIVFFWAHPVMTLDTLYLAIWATIYLYIGTYHQDLRGLRIIGKEWEEYRKGTCLLVPGPKTISRIFKDLNKG